MAPPLRIGYVPEHFSTPLHFARLHYKLDSELVPFPSGTGHMITSLHDGQIDIGIGLTEGWIAGLGKASAEGREAGYKLVGTYVETPLCWAISTGSAREDVAGRKVDGLKGSKMGVSRVGSGSYVMGFVLADTHDWLSNGGGTQEAPFDVVPLQTFENLRKAVNDRTADFFMWEHFTSKRYFSPTSQHPIHKLGEIYTPWPSWHIVARDEVIGDIRLEEFMTKLDLGVEYFEEHQEEAVRLISTEMDYEEEDAREWLATVRFAKEVKGVRSSVVEKTVGILRKAGVLGTDVNTEGMVRIRRKE